MVIRSRILLLLWLVAALDAPWGESQARASSFYYEFQGGLAQIRNGEPFFTGAPGTSDMGVSLGGTFAYSFTGGAIPLEPQLGLEYRVATGSRASTDYYGIQAPYLMTRVQLSRLYLGIGYAPYVWRRAGSGPGLDFFSHASGSAGFLAEAGFLWPVTPEFTLGLSGAAQFITTAGALAPKPTTELTALMRFYFGFSSKSGSASSRGSNEFHGWRYPFGNEMRK